MADDWDGLTAAVLARRCQVPRLEVFAEIDSTMDLAHRLALEDAPAGTVVLADTQHAGRGRLGRSWSSEPGAGVWCTVLERPPRASAELLSVRTGLRLAHALDAFADKRVGLKWPNDLVLQFSKLGGILVEARWMSGALAWVAIGVGVNVVTPATIPDAAGLRPGVQRADVLIAVVHAVRAAAAATGDLTRDELVAYAERDVLAGRRIIAPAPGNVAGISASGALIVETANGTQQVRTGSISLAEDS